MAVLGLGCYGVDGRLWSDRERPGAKEAAAGGARGAGCRRRRGKGPVGAAAKARAGACRGRAGRGAGGSAGACVKAGMGVIATRP